MGTHYPGTPKEKRALDALIKLLRAADAVSRRTRGAYTGEGLTESQFGVLEALYFVGPATPGELSRRILKTAGNLTLVVDNLIKSGLVAPSPSAEDRRRRPVALTTAGRKLIADLFPHHVDGVVETFSVLTVREQEELGRLCRKLGLGPADPSN